MKLARKMSLGLAVAASIALGVISITFAPAQSRDGTEPRSQSTPAETDTIVGYTRPSSYELKLSISQPGIVKEILVKEGDVVKAGQVLLTLEDEIEKKELERLQLVANSKARIEAAEADLAVKKAILKRKTEANDSGMQAYNKSEIEEAENDVILREKQLQVAKEDQMEAKIKAEQQAAKVDKLQMKSPIDGIVLNYVAHVGEWADPQGRDGTMVIVNNNPLQIEVKDLTAQQVAMLKMGQKLQVGYPDRSGKATKWEEAEVVYFSAVAELSTQFRLFKLRMKNPQAVPAGLEVVVKLPADVAAAGRDRIGDAAGGQ